MRKTCPYSVTDTKTKRLVVVRGTSARSAVYGAQTRKAQTVPNQKRGIRFSILQRRWFAIQDSRLESFITQS
jgi:hypothetical protein